MKAFISFTVLFFICLIDFNCSAIKMLKVEAIVKDISCFGKQDGEIELLISGGRSPYSVEWSDGANLTNRDKLGKGSYSFRVVDAKGMFFESEVSITNPAPLSVYFSQHENCLSSESGDLNIAIEGGTPFSSNWDERYKVSIEETYNEKKASLENKLKITDSKSCSLSFPVNLTVIDPTDEFMNRTKPSANPLAEVQVKREINDRMVLSKSK